jgi:DNA-binding CsgD family transcriptional regulator
VRRDLIAVVEAGYRLDPAEPDWLRGVLHAAQPLLDAGLGVIGWQFEQHGRVRTTPVCVGCPDGFGVAVETAHRTVSRRMRRAYVHPKLFATMQERLGGRGLAEFPDVAELMRMGGVYDFAGLEAPDVDGSGVILGAPLPREMRTAAHTVRMWERVAGHLAAALRLRRAAVRDPATVRDPDAVVAADGRVAHARGAAKERSAREALRAAALAAERARGPLRTGDPGRALALWRALVDARWSLVDHFDTDGRRYLVAMRNDPRVPHPSALTERERQVVALAALGRANKCIAYELGLSLGVVGAYLTSAMRKLGVASRVELVRLRAALERDEAEAERA